MVSVCIYVLQDAMHTVHSAYDITPSGIKHSNPLMDKEIAKIAAYLHDNHLHTCIMDCKGHNDTEPIVNLLASGMEYTNTTKAF